MKPLVLLLAAASTLSAAITGVVVNKTTSQPQPGVTITMTKIGQGGMVTAGTAVSDAQGRFSIDSGADSAHLLQADFQGVKYNVSLAQGATSPVEVAVFSAAARVAEVKPAQHMILVETDGQELVVSETIVYANPSTTTWNSPSGTARIYVPPSAGDNVMARVFAQGGMPLERTPKKTSGNIWTVDYPVKPGETRFDFSYKLPASSGAVLETRILDEGGSPRLVLPQGVSVEGEGLVSLGSEPSTRASIYDIQSRAVKLTFTGSGVLRSSQPESESAESDGPRIKQILPPGYERHWKLALGLTLAFLALGFAAHYLKGSAPAAKR